MCCVSLWHPGMKRVIIFHDGNVYLEALWSSVNLLTLWFICAFKIFTYLFVLWFKVLAVENCILDMNATVYSLPVFFNVWYLILYVFIHKMKEGMKEEKNSSHNVLKIVNMIVSVVGCGCLFLDYKHNYLCYFAFREGENKRKKFIEFKECHRFLFYI